MPSPPPAKSAPAPVRASPPRRRPVYAPQPPLPDSARDPLAAEPAGDQLGAGEHAPAPGRAPRDQLLRPSVVGDPAPVSQTTFGGHGAESPPRGRARGAQTASSGARRCGGARLGRRGGGGDRGVRAPDRVVAGGPVAVAVVDQRRLDLRADLGRARGSAVWKRQAGGGFAGLGTSPSSTICSRAALARRVGDRHRREQRERCRGGSGCRRPPRRARSRRSCRGT